MKAYKKILFDTPKWYGCSTHIRINKYTQRMFKNGQIQTINHILFDKHMSAEELIEFIIDRYGVSEDLYNSINQRAEINHPYYLTFEYSLFNDKTNENELVDIKVVLTGKYI